VKAWQFTGTHQPLVLNDVPEPTAGPEEVLIDIKAAGLCHSDVSVLEVDDFPLPAKAHLPVTLGHEIAGVISEVGADVRGWKPGDRAAIGNIPDLIPGIFRDGGYAARITSRAEFLLRIPDAVSFAQAAVGTDAGMTAHSGMIGVGRASEGDKVGVIGLGGLGQIGARIAVLAGCEVYVAEPKRDLWRLAAELGAVWAVSDIRDLARENLDLIVDYAGFGTTTAGAIEAIREGGRIVQVGMGVSEATISTHLVTMKGITLVGSLGGTLDDTRSVYKLMAGGMLQPVITTITFDKIPDGLRRLSAGTVVGRLVATYDAG
jgi:propanol-preferring alcohol dehydrogenase